MALNQLFLYKEAKKKNKDKGSNSLVIPLGITATGAGVAGASHLYGLKEKEKIKDDVKAHYDKDAIMRRAPFGHMKSPEEAYDAYAELITRSRPMTNEELEIARKVNPNIDNILKSIKKYKLAQKAKIGGGALAGLGALATAYKVGQNDKKYS